MKIKFAILVLVASIPSAVMAGVNLLNHDPVYIVSILDSELGKKPTQTIKNYRMV